MEKTNEILATLVAQNKVLRRQVEESKLSQKTVRLSEIL